ncbi:MAG TPA: ferrous iron transport protein B [Candidatus Coprenecus avistercoris]|uniref:Ferrous iron transport protein B n=1 Tax=Candidatus Coprenecus avistercoris TaxID=2840730 RepID=A0A9D1J5Y1_9BACT|nr:ferrous iron transport protein B [Candidatus Coprenecus avistercoris]
MKLSDLKTGERGIIVKVSGHGSFRKRITEMGFIKGKEVRVVLNAPLRDPIEYEIIGYKISLRRDEAREIEVISESEAKAQASQDNVTEPEASRNSAGTPGLSSREPDCSDAEDLDRRMRQLAEERRHTVRVALVGNPNCGKTSMFNIASGSHERVGNYSGVTVDAKEGRFEYKGYHFVLVDLPGTYSLSAYSPEELYVRKNLIDNIPDVVINVVDASNLERNLYLTAQIIDMNLRVVMAMNMYDELEARGDRLDTVTLGHLLGMPVVPTVSRSGQGIDRLFDTVIQIYEHNEPSLSRHIHINHGQELENSIDRIKLLIQKNDDIRTHYSTRWLAIKYLENDSDVEAIVEALPNHDEIIAARFEENRRIEGLLGGTNAEAAIVDAKYAFVQGALKETYTPGQVRKKHTITDKIDAVVTNRWAAFPIFILLLYIIFEATFRLGEYPMTWIEWLVEKFGAFVATTMPEGMLKDLVVDGIIGGVGSVLVFLPNILILYLFISLLEDSGYMARAAFIMDKLMHKIGLHGKSFIPMIMGFGCNVPAIMATRTIENHKSRLVTMLIIPMMSCAGRLPVYILVAGAFFPRNGSLVLLGLYALGIVMAIISAKIMSRFIKDDNLPFVMELPPYRVPTSKSVFRHTWEKGKQYLHKMAGIILVASIIIWFLGYFPHHDRYATPAEQQENSYIGMIGKAIEPVLEPLGFDWKMGVGIISGVAAKELVVSTMGVLYSGEYERFPASAGTDTVTKNTPSVNFNPASKASEATFVNFEADSVNSATAGVTAETALANDATAPQTASGDTMLQNALARTTTPAAALAFMVFVLLYFPCIATFVAIKNESGGWKWAIISAVYTIVLAWIVAFIVYRIALLLL